MMTLSSLTKTLYSRGRMEVYEPTTAEKNGGIDMTKLTTEKIQELYEQHYMSGVCDFYTFAQEVVKAAEGAEE